MLSYLAHLALMFRARRAARRRAAKIASLSPLIDISDHGWAGGFHQISAGISSPKGTMTLFAYTCDDANNALLTSRVQTMAHITGLPVVDRRPMCWNDAKTSMLTEEWYRAPRDAKR